ncbi:M20 metallopeptidase family protein [Flavobacterium piscisymbiosum]|uniref:M20/M25/M40 family metallo-hydrolase n=1 Tax=Flavobacterium piscisymbiosum TaxID=2893753 RepID=A0ABS8MLP7_9FLAO|nr:M20/M25/M40 family metallo-hydrolase [Flavobacterium sp. F-30]MCC9066418.1 M20/M25/M40 family metallo-hydrolase [Flavobacterium sp. F-30]
MKLILSIFILVFIFSLEQIDKENPSKLSVENATHKRISADTDKIYDKLVELRRDFHENPELAGNEKRTQEIVKQYLLDLGIEVVMEVHGYSIVGILKGDKKGKSIAWRADMDALPNDFPDKVDFKSKIKGIQHGCGHDVHLAIALGIAEVLSKNKQSIKGTIYFIFQSEEETFAGAKGMIDKGLFSKINPEEIYGLHISALPVGEIMVKPNEMFAYQKRIRIKLKDELSKDETKALTAKIQSLLSRVQTCTKPWEIQSIVDPEIGLINQNTIFKDYLFVDGQFNVYSKNGELFLEAYLYETNKSNLPKIIPQIEELLAKEKYTQKVISVSFVQENPTVINDENLTKKAIKSLNKIYGNNLVVNDFGQIPYFNDDFAYFQQKIPGVYFLLGGSNSEKGIVAMNHAPNFTVDEESIKIGVRSFSSLIIERLNTK